MGWNGRDRNPRLLPNNADVAQLVEHVPEEHGVVGSIPTVSTNY